MSEGAKNHAEELLRNIGPKLKAAREAKNLTLQEVSSRTRINAAFLEQIEIGRTENLPGLTFVRGFIRNYLQVLELRDEEIEADLNQIGGLEQFKTETALGPRINEMHGDDDLAEAPIRKNLVLGLVVVLVVVVGYLGLQVLSSSGDDAPSTTVVEQQNGQETAQTPPQEGQPADVPPPEKPLVSIPDAANAKAKNVPVASAQNLRLTVRGLESTWIRLSIDRSPPVEIRMAPAETMNWDANEEFRLVIGKSHGVAVYLNGEDILLPAERNQLIPDVVLNKLTLLRLEN